MTATPPARIDHLRIERGRDNAFAGLSHEQRMRLMVQVLCGLVAYDEKPSPTHSPAEPGQDHDLTERLAS